MVACTVTELVPKEDFNLLYNNVNKQLEAYAIAKDSEKWATYLLLNARKRKQLKYQNYCQAYEQLSKHPEFTEKHRRQLQEYLADINTSFTTKG